MRILLVEDDELIAEPLVKALTNQHYTVDAASDGEAGWDLVESFKYDLILLDVMLPKLDGISFCRRLRSASHTLAATTGDRTPILLLTAQDDSNKKIVALDAGADDYLAKPFDMQELLARIRALLRRGSATLLPLLTWRNIQLDPSSCEVTCDTQALHLTPKEYSLLELFLRNPHRIYNCGALIDHLWSLEEPPTDDTVRSHLKGLRQKLKAAGVAEDPIYTVYGIGYRLKPERKESKPQGSGDTVARDTLPVETSAGVPPVTLRGVIETISASTYYPRGEDTYQNDGQDNLLSIPTQVEAGVAQVWQQVAATLSDRVAVIEQAATLLSATKLSAELQNVAKGAAHKLVGSMGMFGSDAGSTVAGEIESLLTIENITPENSLQLCQLAADLRHHLQSLNAEQVPNPYPGDAPSQEMPLLLLMSADTVLMQAVVGDANSWGCVAQVAESAIAAQDLIATRRPDIAVVDLASTQSADNMSLLAQLAAGNPSVPVIAITAADSLVDRVQVLRWGGRVVLQEPVSPTQVLASVTQLLQQTRPPRARVLVVDDDPQILALLQGLLEPWGLHVTTLDNPLRFLEVMSAIAPDLLVLDVEMPEINGIELCQVVRNDQRWQGLPILFLTAHKDAKTRHHVFAAGADDYVSKPVVAPELVTRIFNRLERDRLLRSFAEVDPITGLANRQKCDRDLNQLWQWCINHHQPLSLAIIKLTRLKKINHQYGHAVGDMVLSRCGQLLRQTLPPQDVVGRWGGAEFVIGMGGMTKIEGEQRLVEVVQSLQKLQFNPNNTKPFRLTCKTGIAQYPQDGADISALYRTADATQGKKS